MATRFPRTKLLRRVHILDEELSDWADQYLAELGDLHPEETKRRSDLENRWMSVLRARKLAEDLRTVLFGIGVA